MKRLVLLLTVAMVFPLAPVASDDAKTAQAPEQTGDQTGPQAYQHPIIVLDQNNTQYRIGAHAPDSIPIKSRFDKGVVVDMSAERNNPSGLQRYVAVRYPVALGYGGEVVSKGEVIVIYANLKQINVEMGANVVQGQELGMTFSKNDEGDTEFSVFVLTAKPDNAYLTLQTKDQKIEYKGYWYWNGSFLF